MSLDPLVYGEIIDNYIVDATDTAATNAKWTSTTKQEYTVPAGKRWILLPSVIILDASSTLSVYVYNRNDKAVSYIATYSAGTGAKPYPMYANNMGAMPIIMDEGEYIDITCGSAQGAGAKASCRVLELNI